MSFKPLVAITQRVDVISARSEVRDSLDQTWVSLLRTVGVEIVVLPNTLDDPVDYARSLGVRGLVLSGGNDISSAFCRRDGGPGLAPSPDGLDVQSARDRLEEKLLHASLELQWPVLGVCRGMQAMNVFHGGRLESVAGHVRTRHALESGLTTPFSLDSEVNSYHGFGIPLNGVASGFDMLARTGETVEAIWNPAIHHLGVMWHPERNFPFSQNDLELFRTLFCRARI